MIFLSPLDFSCRKSFSTHKLHVSLCTRHDPNTSSRVRLRFFAPLRLTLAVRVQLVHISFFMRKIIQCIARSCTFLCAPSSDRVDHLICDWNKDYRCGKSFGAIPRKTVPSTPTSALVTHVTQRSQFQKYALPRDSFKELEDKCIIRPSREKMHLPAFSSPIAMQVHPKRGFPTGAVPEILGNEIQVAPRSRSNTRNKKIAMAAVD